MQIKWGNPFQGIELLQQEMERLFNDMWGQYLPTASCRREAWHPPTDAYETTGGLVIKVELAGMRDREIEIVLDERVLVISGVRPSERPPHCISYHQMGVNYGPFCIQVFLPWPVDREGVQATYEDGFLEIYLPRRRTEQEAGRRVRIPVTEE